MREICYRGQPLPASLCRGPLGGRRERVKHGEAGRRDTAGGVAWPGAKGGTHVPVVTWWWLVFSGLWGGLQGQDCLSCSLCGDPGPGHCPCPCLLLGQSGHCGASAGAACRCSSWRSGQGPGQDPGGWGRQDSPSAAPPVATGWVTVQWYTAVCQCLAPSLPRLCPLPHTRVSPWCPPSAKGLQDSTQGES